MSYFDPGGSDLKGRLPATVPTPTAGRRAMTWT